MGHWKYPSNCSPENHTCEYYAQWETVGRGDVMRWYIETSNTKTWTGVGFSDDEKMSQTDAVIGWVDRNGRPFLMDTWINGYGAPKLDVRQDIIGTPSGRIEYGVTILEFDRKRVSNDEQVGVEGCKPNFCNINVYAFVFTIAGLIVHR